MQSGDPVALRDDGGTWTPWRFVSKDGTRLTLRRVLPTQPPLCVIDHDVTVVALGPPAKDFEFRYGCITCHFTGSVAPRLRTRIAGAGLEELLGAAAPGKNDLVDCPVCDGEGTIVWDPFRERPTCELPPGGLLSGLLWRPSR